MSSPKFALMANIGMPIRYFFLLLLLLALSFQCSRLGLRQRAGGKSLKLMTFNICKNGISAQRNRQTQIASLIAKHDPDVLCLQESGQDTFWTAFADARGFVHTVVSSKPDGQSVFARMPITKDYDHASFTYVQIGIAGKTLGIYNLHLPWRVDEDDKRLSVLQKVRELIAEHGDDFVCVAGDFNSRTRGEWGKPACVDSISKRSGLPSPIDETGWVQATAQMSAEEFVDCYRTLNKDAGHTFQSPWSPVPAERTRRACVRIDYVFANAKLAPRLQGCRLDNSPEAHQASDHLPVIAIFRF